MKVAVHLRGGPNRTNVRSEAIADGFYALGHHVEYLPRSEASKTADLVVQTGFCDTTALKGAIDRQMPYIVMEAPPFRTLCDEAEWSSWGYNGLAGGAYRPEAPDEERPTPSTAPRKEAGDTLIIGQKPTDHSLRGSDHIGWLKAKLRESPWAKLRHHPLMVDPPCTIEEALDGVQSVITYTSTVGVDAAVAGCEVIVEGPGSWWIQGVEREAHLHALSWAAFSNLSFAQPKYIGHILSGYDEAAALAAEGTVEVPRGKIDGRAICQQYYQQVIR